MSEPKIKPAGAIGPAVKPISASAFRVPAIESSELIRRAKAQDARRRRRQNRTAYVQVNVSDEGLGDPKFVFPQGSSQDPSIRAYEQKRRRGLGIATLSPEEKLIRAIFGEGPHQPPSPSAAASTIEQPGVANEEQAAENPSMSEPTREEFDAKLNAVESRIGGAVAGMVGKLDGALAEMKADRHRFATIDKNLDEIKGELKTAQDKTDASASSVKTTVIVTAIGTVTALAALVLGMLQFMQSSFSAGKEQGSTLSQAASDIKQTQEQLKALQERLERQAIAPQPPASK